MILSNTFLDTMGDYYGSWTFEEFAELVGVPTSELMGYLSDSVEESLDIVEEEMGWKEPEDEEIT